MDSGELAYLADKQTRTSRDKSVHIVTLQSALAQTKINRIQVWSSACKKAEVIRVESRTSIAIHRCDHDVYQQV